MKHRMPLFLAFIMMSLLVAGLIGSTDLQAAPGIIQVSATCTLPNAVLSANTNTSVGGCQAGIPLPGVDKIIVPNGTYVLSSRLQITESVDILGSGTATTIVDGGGVTVVFYIGAPLSTSPRPAVTISNLTVRNGYTDNGDYGGGIAIGRPFDADVTLDHLNIINNKSGRGGGIGITDGNSRVRILRSTIDSNQANLDLGGGIFINGYLSPATSAKPAGLFELIESTVSNNSSITFGGGLDLTVNDLDSTGNYSNSPPKINIVNSTISGNTSQDHAGMVLIGSHSYNDVQLNSVTFYGNSITSPKGLAAAQLYSQGLWTANNVLFQNPVGSFNCYINQAADKTNVLRYPQFNYSIQSDSTCIFPGGTGNQVPMTVTIGALANNGGPTKTHALPAGSKAIDVGGACPNIDQRGASRPVNSICDVGAYEFGANVPAATATPTATTVVPTITPTNTPTATSTSTPGSTNTPASTSTPRPTSTPGPKPTPAPSPPSNPDPAPPAVESAPITRFHPLNPSFRILDTRGGQYTDASPADVIRGRFKTGEKRIYQIAGVGGIPANANAVCANVTAAYASGEGDLVIQGSVTQGFNTVHWYSTGSRIIANFSFLTLKSDGTIEIENRGGETDVLIDVSCYFADTKDGSVYTPLPITRNYDSRAGYPALAGQGDGKMTVGDNTRKIYLKLPKGTTAVIISIVGSEVYDYDGWLAAYAGDLTSMPNISSVNWSNSNRNLFNNIPWDIANLAVVPVGEDGSINIAIGGSSDNGNPVSAHVIVDVLGAFVDTNAIPQAERSNLSVYRPINGLRIASTNDGGLASSRITPLKDGETDTLYISAIKGIPADVEAVVIRVETYDSKGPGYLSVYSDIDGGGSTVNVTAPGQEMGNLAIVKVVNGKITIKNGSHQPMGFKVYICGYFTKATS